MQKLGIGYKTATGRFYKLRKKFEDLDQSEGPAQNEDSEKPSDNSNAPTGPEVQVMSEVEDNVQDHPSSDLAQERLEYA
ncbi:hypothetical protein VI817_006855 [Penicillium citrinum]|nr:hypothetical protein VI817_006855 [Penicillium citrinum]